MSESVDSDVNNNSETARTPLSGTFCYNEQLDADSTDDPRSIHLGCDLLYICAVTCEHPQSEYGCHSTSLNVGNDIVGETPQHQERGSSEACAVAREHPQGEGGCHSTSLNVGNDIVGETLVHQ